MVLRKLLKILAGLGIALLIVTVFIAVLGFFALRGLDPNVFRSGLEEYLVQQTGFRTELGEMRFKWGAQLELQVDSLKFYHPRSLEKLLQSDNVQISADLASLLRKRFWMTQVVILNPEIHVQRSRDGSWNWQVPRGAAVIPKPANPTLAVAVLAAHGQISKVPGSSALTTVKNLPGSAGGWDFGLGRVEIRNGTLQYVDETIQPIFRIKAERVEVTVLQKNANTAFQFKTTAQIADLSRKDLQAEGDVDLISRSLDFALHYGQDQILFKGILKVVNTVPRFNGALEIRDLKVETVIPEVYKRGDYVSGLLNAKMQLSFEGGNPDSIKRSLRGQGKVTLRDGALRNRNLVKDVLDRLSPVIAITGALEGELPPAVNDMLQDRDTPFQSLGLSCGIASGEVQAGEFSLLHPNYQLKGEGNFRIPDLRLDAAMKLTLSLPISNFLVKKIRELQYLCDRKGSLVIPFRYSGMLPEATVQPDLSYITAKVLQEGADQLINRGLQKLSKYLESKNEKNSNND